MLAVNRYRRVCPLLDAVLPRGYYLNALLNHTRRIGRWNLCCFLEKRRIKDDEDKSPYMRTSIGARCCSITARNCDSLLSS
jgi:hypothetical protein